MLLATSTDILLKDLEIQIKKTSNDKEVQEYVRKKIYDAMTTRNIVNILKTQQELKEEQELHIRNNKTTKMFNKKTYLESKSNLNIIKCSMKDIDSKKLKLIKDNINSFMLDIENMFLESAFVEVIDEYGNKKEIIYSTRNNEMFLIIVEKGSKNNRFVSLINDSNMDDILSTICYEDYLKARKKMIIPEEMVDYAQRIGREELALIFYINQLTMTRKKISSKSIRNNGSYTSNKKNKKEIELSKKTYIVTPSGLREKSKGKRTEGRFDVAGHWREYKSGKKIWINQFEKGNGKKITKTYRVRKEK